MGLQRNKKYYFCEKSKKRGECIVAGELPEYALAGGGNQSFLTESSRKTGGESFLEAL